MVGKKHNRQGQSDYRYDVTGRTRSKQTASGTQYYHYDAEHRLTEVRIEQLNHTERYGYVYDALGRRIEKHRLDSDGKPCNRTTFLWDRMQMIQESSADKRQSLRYQGQYLDRETGLHYNTLRYDDSDIGRFTQSDTIGFLGSYNL
ncbi:RHS repeat-associated core domain-containing protein [Snodgrassella sp. ESL0323]|uniref:RHS repeat-associated core domain-containing protein n=1 Tax=Snodgrassella sp. ESL0323 TaxID=2705034 RepID=UPI002113037B|nr:RHS repeat-associated core domain-containing protein [Snodgrassella sp. ESL0323]